MSSWLVGISTTILTLQSLVVIGSLESNNEHAERLPEFANLFYLAISLLSLVATRFEYDLNPKEARDMQLGPLMVALLTLLLFVLNVVFSPSVSTKAKSEGLFALFGMCEIARMVWLGVNDSATVPLILVGVTQVILSISYLFYVDTGVRVRLLDEEAMPSLHVNGVENQQTNLVSPPELIRALSPMSEEPNPTSSVEYRNPSLISKYPSTIETGSSILDQRPTYAAVVQHIANRANGANVTSSGLETAYGENPDTSNTKTDGDTKSKAKTLSLRRLTKRIGAPSFNSVKRGRT